MRDCSRSRCDSGMMADPITASWVRALCSRSRRLVRMCIGAAPFPAAKALFLCWKRSPVTWSMRTAIPFRFVLQVGYSLLVNRFDGVAIRRQLSLMGYPILSLGPA